MERTTTITLRDLDPDDVDALKAEAAATRTSLNRLVGELVHRRARTARNRARFAAISAADHAPPEDVDAAAEVRAIRDESEERAVRIADEREARR